MRCWLFIIVSFFAARAWAQSTSELDQYAQNSLAATFVTAALLANEDVIKLGIWNFDPSSFVSVASDEFGSEESTKLRQSITQISLPLSIDLAQPNSSYELSLVGGLAYLDVEQEVALVSPEQEQEDTIDQTIWSAALGLRLTHTGNEHWGTEISGNVIGMRYENYVKFRALESQIFAPYLDGLFTNYQANLLLLDPGVGGYYQSSLGSGSFQLFSLYRYLIGHSINAKIEAHSIMPEAWYWTNGVVYKKPIFADQTWWFRLAKVSVGGDLNSELGSNHYYEAGVIWTIDLDKRFRVIDNVGFGLNFNYGSDLRGGTLLLVYNFDGFR